MHTFFFSSAIWNMPFTWKQPDRCACLCPKHTVRIEFLTCTQSLIALCLLYWHLVWLFNTSRSSVWRCTCCYPDTTSKGRRCHSTQKAIRLNGLPGAISLLIKSLWKGLNYPSETDWNWSRHNRLITNHLWNYWNFNHYVCVCKFCIVAGCFMSHGALIYDVIELLLALSR